MTFKLTFYKEGSKHVCKSYSENYGDVWLLVGITKIPFLEVYELDLEYMKILSCKLKFHKE